MALQTTVDLRYVTDRQTDRQTEAHPNRMFSTFCNKIGNVRIKLKLWRVSVTIVAKKTQQYGPYLLLVIYK